MRVAVMVIMLNATAMRLKRKNTTIATLTNAMTKAMTMTLIITIKIIMSVIMKPPKGEWQRQ